MDRREALSLLGAAAAGLAGTTVTAADNHAASQDLTPIRQIHLHLCAFHIAKRDPKFVVAAHHYCSKVSDDVHQCVIYDSPGKTARILGVEYIISDRLYRNLPAGEKKYYHPHTYEVIAGLLAAPGLPGQAEKELMETVLTTWGKTWHTWPDPKNPLPMGEPLLMWSATRDGQIAEELLAQRDCQFNISTDEIRKDRAYIGPVPQIAPPKSLDDLGRQWTNEGADERPKK
jgi:hypothetical protein